MSKLFLVGFNIINVFDTCQNNMPYAIMAWISCAKGKTMGVSCTDFKAVVIMEERMNDSSVELVKVRVVEDVQVNDEEIVRKGSVGLIKYKRIHFPHGEVDSSPKDVDSSPKDVDMKYVIYDHIDKFWKDKVEIIQ